MPLVRVVRCEPPGSQIHQQTRQVYLHVLGSSNESSGYSDDFLASSAVQVWDEGHSSDTPRYRLAQANVFWTDQFPGRCCVGVFLDQPGLLSQGPILTTCFRVTSCTGMTVEAQLLNDRILNDSVIPIMLKARTSIFLKICHLHGRPTSLNAGKTASTTNPELFTIRPGLTVG